MIRLIPVEVNLLPVDETDGQPAAILLGNEEIAIAYITDRWYQGDNNPEFPEADYYKVSGMNGREYLLKHELEKDTWFLCRSD